MIETLEPELASIWLRRFDPNLHRYDWDAQKNFVLTFSILHTWNGDKLKNNDQKMVRILSGLLEKCCPVSG